MDHDRRTPRPAPAIQATLNQAFVNALADPAIKGDLIKAGVDVGYEPPSAYDARVTRELPLIRAYVHKAGLTPD